MGATPGGTRLQAAVAVRVNLLYDDTTTDVHHSEQVEAVFAPLDQQRLDTTRAYTVDYDDRDLRTEAPAGARYKLPAAPIDTKAYFTAIETGVKDHLVRSRQTTVFGNKGLKLYSRPGESRDDFEARCKAAADAAADADTDKIRARLQTKIDRLQDGLTHWFPDGPRSTHW